MVANDTDGIEVRAVAQGVAVSDHDNVVVVFNRGSDGGINAEISCPSGNQEPIRRDLFQARLQFRCGERIVQAVCTENLIRVDAVMESPKLAE
jgi:hypothetical protein